MRKRAPSGDINRPFKKPRFVRGTSASTPMTDTIMTTTENTGVQFVPGTTRRRGFKRGRRLTPRQRTEVNKIINTRSELKFVLSNQVAVGIPNTWTFFKIAGISQGQQDSQRDGDRLTWVNNPICMNHLVVNALGVTGDIYNNVRIVILQWHPNDAVAPVVGDIFLNGNTGAIDFSSQYNHDKRQLYTVIFDRNYKTVGNGVNAQQPLTSDVQSGLQMSKISTRFLKKQVQYNAGTTAGTNQIYLIACSDSAVATHPTLFFAIKTYFRDL